ncbi:MAG: hypothetical protein IT270_12660, partial [Saprospiraceae bacterium]|nr:hypothetical protein [Saprospiraceae bacterium]
MKNKIVVWGTNAENEKVLIALELQADANKVQLYTFPEAVATEEFVNKMMADWRNGAEVPFPEGFTQLERPLSITESLLPDDLKVDRGDLIQRAQTEWQFAVLSAKLHAAYQQELADFKEIVGKLTTYDHQTWDNLRTFWDKVQEQARERNLFREHADSLRDNINVLFDDMKKMRSQVQNEFMGASQRLYEEFNTTLDDIEKRIQAGGSKLNSVFEDLKQMQRRYRDAKMSNEHRNQLWNRLDGAFKAAKERKFGPTANEGSLVERHERRLEGLRDAIKRMEDSIRRDEEELNFQQKKVAVTEGQLEAQIRSAKIKMVEERISSKKEKLNEMNTTRNDVERQVRQAAEKEAKRAEKEVEKQKLDAAKEAAKNEIAASIKTKQPETETPAEEKSGESLLGAIGTILTEAMEDAVDTVKAVASVVSERSEDIIEEITEKASDAAEKVASKAGEMAGDVSESFDKVVAENKGKVTEKAEKVAAKATEVAGDMAQAIDKVIDDNKDVIAETAAKATKLAEKAAAKAAEVAADMADAINKVLEKTEKTEEPAAPEASVAETPADEAGKSEESKEEE